MKTRTIDRVDVFPTRLPVVKTFEFASGLAGMAGGTAPHVFVRMTDSAGEIGWGEGRSHPAWSYETLESVTTTIRAYLAPAVVGLPLTDRWGLHRRMHQAIGRGPSTGQPVAKAAVDMAVHDLCARASEMSLRSYLGGNDDRHSVALSYTVTAHDGEAAAHEVREARRAGYRHFNFKAAVAPATDIAVACAVRDAAGPDAFVWADASSSSRASPPARLRNNPRMAGIKDVAKKAAVSITTASRVLNHVDYPVAAATRQRVVAAARELHYSPSALARALVTHRSGIVGVLGDMVDPYFAEIARGVEDAARKAGYLVIVCNTDRDPAVERRYVETLADYRVDALIFVGGDILTQSERRKLKQVLAAATKRGVLLVACAGEHASLPAIDIGGGHAAPRHGVGGNGGHSGRARVAYHARRTSPVPLPDPRA